MPHPRQPVLDALKVLPDASWFLVLAAAKGLLEQCALTVNDDPRDDTAAIVQIERHIHDMNRVL